MLWNLKELFSSIDYTYPIAGGECNDKFLGWSASDVDDIPQDVRLVRRAAHHQTEQFRQFATLLPAEEYTCCDGWLVSNYFSLSAGSDFNSLVAFVWLVGF